jgi:hypothetical protein
MCGYAFGHTLPFPPQLHVPTSVRPWSSCLSLIGRISTRPGPNHEGPGVLNQGKASADHRQVHMAIRHRVRPVSALTKQFLTHFWLIILLNNNPVCSTTNTGNLWSLPCLSGIPGRSLASGQLPNGSASLLGSTAIHANTAKWLAKGYSQTQPSSVHTLGSTSTSWPTGIVHHAEYTWEPHSGPPTHNTLPVVSPGPYGKDGKTRPDAAGVTGSYRRGVVMMHLSVWGTAQNFKTTVIDPPPPSQARSSFHPSPHAHPWLFCTIHYGSGTLGLHRASPFRRKAGFARQGTVPQLSHGVPQVQRQP